MGLLGRCNAYLTKCSPSQEGDIWQALDYVYDCMDCVNNVSKNVNDPFYFKRTKGAASSLVKHGYDKLGEKLSDCKNYLSPANATGNGGPDPVTSEPANNDQPPVLKDAAPGLN